MVASVDSAVVATDRHFLLAGDIGGTNSRLALYDRSQNAESASGSRYKDSLFAKEYLNEEHLEDDNDGDPGTDNDGSSSSVKQFVRAILAPFLEEAWKSDAMIVEGGCYSTMQGATIVCCLGVAGPVDPSSHNGTVTTSQRGYLRGLNGTGIVEHCQSKRTAAVLSLVKSCVVINDFVAQGYGCLSLSTTVSGELQRLDGSSSCSNLANGPKFCVGAGTGFGSCYMVPTNVSETEYSCFPSEYGQSDWAPNAARKDVENDNETIEGDDDDQTRLWKHLKQTTSHIAVEHVVSGTGLATAYECLAGLFPEQANQGVREEFESHRDLRGKVVGDHADDCEICARAVQTILRAYGSVVGSCAMAFLPTGGLYITGGLFLNLMKNALHANATDSASSAIHLFLKAYRCKGAASFLLNTIPLYVVLAKDTGLRGAAVRAEMEFKSHVAAALK